MDERWLHEKFIELRVQWSLAGQANFYKKMDENKISGRRIAHFPSLPLVSP